MPRPYAQPVVTPHRSSRPVGTVTRGTTNPNRLRRIDRWLAAVEGRRLRRAADPLVVDLGYGASPVTTVELFDRLRAVRPDVEVVGLEIDPARVTAAQGFARDGPELRAGRVRAAVAGRAPAGARPRRERPAPVRRGGGAGRLGALASRLAPDGLVVDATCDELGRRACWLSARRMPVCRNRFR